MEKPEVRKQQKLVGGGAAKYVMERIEISQWRLERYLSGYEHTLLF